MSAAVRMHRAAVLVFRDGATKRAQRHRFDVVAGEGAVILHAAMPALTIRPARPAEAARLTAIAFASKRDWGYPAKWLAAWAPRLTVTSAYIREHAVFVARAGRRLRGFYALVETPKYWELDHFWIHPDAIGQGIGRRLFTHARAYVDRRGPRVLRIIADPNAVGFYQRMGAHRMGTVAAPIGRLKRRLPRLEVRL
jgi:ribosomal protein S18 acetylase RimI-like enzyme